MTPVERRGGRMRGAPFRRSGLRWALSAGAVLVSGGCATIVGGAIEAATGGKVTATDDGEVGRAALQGAGRDSDEKTFRSVHLVGPTPGWEHHVLPPGTVQPSPLLFDVDLLAGTCPINFVSRRRGDPFGGLARPRFDPIGFGPYPATDLDVYRFGEIGLFGAPGAGSVGVLNWIPPQSPWVCLSVGIPLFPVRPPALPHAFR